MAFPELLGIPSRLHTFDPTYQEAVTRVGAVNPTAYARSRNALDGAVTGLSPYFTHGLLSLPDASHAIHARHALGFEDKLVFEFGWREFFHHVWAHQKNPDAILQDMHAAAVWHGQYAETLPLDIREGCTGVAAVDKAVRILYATGYLHNHMRMWLASYVVHVRKVHWRAGADWLYGHLLDGDLPSNHLSWQWVAGTGSSKPYLFNAETVVRYAPLPWHSPGSVVDVTYDAMDRLAHARSAVAEGRALMHAGQAEPHCVTAPPAALGFTVPDAAAVQGRDVWIVHPWSLGALPAGLPADTVVLGLAISDFHRAWPWSESRWAFVGARMAAVAPLRWHADAAAIGAALAGARRVRAVRAVHEPHLAPWLAQLADCQAAPQLFPAVDRRCDSFSQWWTRCTRGLQGAEDLLAVNEVPAC